MNLLKIKVVLIQARQYFKEHFLIWVATFISKARTFSDWCNVKFLRGLDQLEEKVDPAEKFMADTGSRHAQGASIFSHMALWITLLFFAIAFIWAKFAILDEVIVGEGKIIPASQVQIIQNLEGGIVKKIWVHEGEVVQAGQVLMQLDDARFDADYRQTQTKSQALTIKIARLIAVIENKPFIVPDELKTKAPDLVSHENQLYISQEREQTQLDQSYALNKQEYDLTAPLVAKGAASAVEVLRLQQAMAQSQEQIDSFLSRALQELNTAKGELLEVNASLAGLKDRLARTTIRSPLKGIVKQIKITTVGGVSQPGMELMEIVPVEETLLVEAQIHPKDIGFLHLGQPATVKISAYDFSVYGGLKGTVEGISADSITNQKGDSYYLARIRTDKNYLLIKGERRYIIPGMMATADVLTGQKSVLSYLLKPIFKARDNALRER